MANVRQAVTTLVVHPDASRVLMVKRSRIGAFPDSLVFPGGKIDEADASDAHLEHFRGLHTLQLEERARRVAAVRELSEETGIQVRDLSSVLPVSRWITPEGFPYRFDTWFYILEAPADQVPVADGNEITELRWAAPAELLDAHHRGETELLLPTLAHVSRLSEFGARWREWPHHPLTTLKPVRSTVTRVSHDKIIDRIPEGLGFSTLEYVMRLPS